MLPVIFMLFNVGGIRQDIDVMLNVAGGVIVKELLQFGPTWTNPAWAFYGPN